MVWPIVSLPAGAGRRWLGQKEGSLPRPSDLVRLEGTKAAAESEGREKQWKCKLGWRGLYGKLPIRLAVATVEMRVKVSVRGAGGDGVWQGAGRGKWDILAQIPRPISVADSEPKTVSFSRPSIEKQTKAQNTRPFFSSESVTEIGLGIRAGMSQLEAALGSESTTRLELSIRAGMSHFSGPTFWLARPCGRHASTKRWTFAWATSSGNSSGPAPCCTMLHQVVHVFDTATPLARARPISLCARSINM